MAYTGKVYRLYIEGNDEIEPYYGSTFQQIRKRFVKHKYGFNYYKQTGKKYISSFKLFQYAEEHNLCINVELVEEHIGITKADLLIREAFYQVNKPCINQCKAYRSIDEKKKYGREYMKEHSKDYYELNQDKLKEKAKDYYELNKYKVKNYQSEIITCECGSLVRRGGVKVHIKTNKHKKNLLETHHKKF